MNASTLRSLLAAALLVACSAPGESESPPQPSSAQPELPTFAVIALEHKDAESLTATLNDFIADAARGGTEESETKVLPDPRTNSLLVMASTPRLAEIRTLVALLDVADPE